MPRADSAARAVRDAVAASTGCFLLLVAAGVALMLSSWFGSPDLDTGVPLSPTLSVALSCSGWGSLVACAAVAGLAVRRRTGAWCTVLAVALGASSAVTVAALWMT